MIKLNNVRAPFFVAAALVLSACVDADMPEPPEGRALFVTNCAMCHGSAATGNADLSPPTPDLTRLSVRNGGIFPRARVLTTIDGYTRMQQPDQDMPEFGLLLRGDSVPIETDDGTFTPTPRPLAALLSYLESIQEPS